MPSNIVLPRDFAKSVLTLADILIAFHRKPSCYQDLCVTMNTSVRPNTMGRLVRLLWKDRVIRVHSWSKAASGCYQRVFAVGEALDCPRPDGGPIDVGKTPPKPMIYVDEFVSLWRALREPVDVKALAARAPQGQLDTYLTLTQRLEVAGLLELIGSTRDEPAGPATTYRQRPCLMEQAEAIEAVQHRQRLDAAMRLEDARERHRSMYAANNSVFGYAKSLAGA